MRNGRAGRLGELHRGVDVVVVPVRAHDRHEPAARDSIDDRPGLVRGVDHEALLVVADDPDVVVDLEVLAVDREDPAGDHMVEAIRHSETTERRTSPRSILWNASSTASSAIVSRDELVERQAALQVQVDEHREVAARQAVAVPARPQLAAASEEVDHRQLHLHRGVGHPHLHQGAREITGVERLLEHFGVSDRFDAHVGAVAVGQSLNRLDRVLLAGIDGVRRAELPRPLELAGVEVDRDHLGRTCEHRAHDRGVADPTAAEHRDRVAALHLAGEHRRAQSGHHSAAEQSRDLRRRGRVRPSWPAPRPRASSRRTRRCRARG